MSSEGTKVVVTGGAGFIGSHLTEALVRDGYRVTVLDDLSTGKHENLSSVADSIEFIEGSITDRGCVTKTLEGARYVFHQAAVASVPKSIEDPVGTHEVNVTGTLNVLDAARQQGVRRVVYASSCAVYGDSANLPFAEIEPVRPLSPYALHKAMGERYAALYTSLYGLETVGLRYFNVYGPRQDASSPYSGVVSLFATLLKGGVAPTIYGDGNQTRDFIFVDDVVKANILVAESDDKTLAGSVWNIGSGAAVSVNDLLEMMQKTLGTASTPQHAPARGGEVPQSRADTTKTESILGFSAKVPLREGLRKMLEETKG